MCDINNDFRRVLGNFQIHSFKDILYCGTLVPMYVTTADESKQCLVAAVMFIF
jgi:hypothetical protein